MNFKLKEGFHARSIDGVEVFPESGQYLIYREGNKRLTLLKQPDWLEGMIYVNYVSFMDPLVWDRPFEKVPLTKDDINRVKTHIVEALQLFKCKAIFDLPNNTSFRFRGGVKIVNE